MPAIPPAEQHQRRMINTVFAHFGMGCELLQSGLSAGEGVTVLPILETMQEEVDSGYASAGDFLHVGFTARFRRHELDDKSLTLAVGIVLVPAAAFAGHDAFEITSSPIPHGRKANQLIVQISAVPVP